MVLNIVVKKVSICQRICVSLKSKIKLRIKFSIHQYNYLPKIEANM